jgi:hypothetical protein
MVIDGCTHVVEGNINEITGNDIDIRHCFGQQSFNTVKGTVNIGHINDSHI